MFGKCLISLCVLRPEEGERLSIEFVCLSLHKLYNLIDNVWSRTVCPAVKTALDASTQLDISLITCFVEHLG